MQQAIHNALNLAMLLSILATALWVAAVLRRVARLARYFQLEGYNIKRYALWFLRTRRETRYALGTLAALLLLFIPSFTDFGLYQSISFNYYAPAIQGVVSAGLALLLLLTLPRDRQAKQKFNPTPRARRLLITALVIGAALPIYYLAATLGFNRPDDWPAFLAFAFFAATSGAIALLIAPLMLPLANGLLWPVEESQRRYFMRLASQRLRESGAEVIVITGSYGKTTTKHYLHHLLSGRYLSAMTPRSFNTLMGISKAINEGMANGERFDYYVAEADAYFVGENARICRLIAPKIGLVMTVGPMHLERLGSMENIVTAQYEVVEALPKDGVGVFNGDDPAVRAMFERGYPDTRLMVSQMGLPEARLLAENIRTEADGLHFDLHDRQTGARQEVYAPLFGATNVTNILMAAVTALHLGVPLAEIAARCESLQPADHRLVRRVLPDGTIIIDDAYSANPVGTKAALEVLGLQKGLQNQDARRIVISSGMFELGQMSDAANRQLGEYMAAVATDVILIGPRQTAPVRAGLEGKNFPPARMHTVENLEQALTIYRSLLQPGDALLMLTDLPDTYAA